MDIQEYQKDMKELQDQIIKFIDNEDSSEYDYETIIEYLENQEFLEENDLLYSILNFINSISKHHHRTTDFFKKIEHIIMFFKEQIKQTLSNQKLFHIFKKNKRMLLLLFENGLLIKDEEIKNILSKESNFFNYLFDKSDDNEIEDKKKRGENDQYICQLIREDNIDEFVIHTNQVNLSLEKITIRPSLFETNPLLMKTKPTLIEYAAFFGSMNIIKYLCYNRVIMMQSLWIFAIHSNNHELIHFLEEKRLLPFNGSFEKILKESIKCNHDEIADYIRSKYFNQDEENDFIIKKSLKYYNYTFYPKKIDDNQILYYLSQYDNYDAVRILVETTDIDPNAKIILKK